MLAERAAEGRFFLACIGQFKRGKSTLLNALVGHALLPTGVVPVTSAITILREGGTLAARVRFAGGGWQDVDPADLNAFVSEAENPENAKGVSVVEVSVPSRLLAAGMSLVDTPGIGSVLSGNSAVTQRFVPHIDAALVVLGADPPISGEELALLEDVKKHVHQLVFVLNKADRLSESDRCEAVAFTRSTLQRRLGVPEPELFEISATERMEGRVTRDWQRLEERLLALAQESGTELVRDALWRGTELLAQRVLHEIDEQAGALERPIADSQRRVETLKRCVAEAETAVRELGYRLKAEEDRLTCLFIERRQAFISRVLPETTRELDEAIAISVEQGPALRQRAITLAQELSKQRIEPQLRAEETAAEGMYRESMLRFVAMANEFFERVVASGASDLESLPRAISEAGFSVKSRFFRHELLAIVPQSIGTWLADSLRSRARSVHAIQRATGKYLEHMLETNGARIQNDLAERVLESRRKLESEIRGRLQDMSRSAERALKQAHARRAEGDEAVRVEIERLADLRARVEAIKPIEQR